MQIRRHDAGAHGPGVFFRQLRLVFAAEVKIAASIALAIVIGILLLLLVPIGHVDWEVEVQASNCDPKVAADLQAWADRTNDQGLLVNVSSNQSAENESKILVSYTKLTARNYARIWLFPADNQPLPNFIRVECSPKTIDFKQPRESSPGMMMLAWMISWYAAIIVLVLFFRGRRSVSDQFLPKMQVTVLDWVRWALIGSAASLLATAALHFIGSYGFPLETPQTGLILEAIKRNGLVLLLVIAVGPICEELLFRKWILRAFLIEGSPKLGVAVASLSFAALHTLGEPFTVAAAVYYSIVCLLSVGLCLMYMRAGTVWAPALAHIGYNAMSIGTVLLANNVSAAH